MSMFLCHTCDNLRDSDDGCEEGPGFSLICQDCADEACAERESASEPRGDAQRRATPDLPQGDA